MALMAQWRHHHHHACTTRLGHQCGTMASQLAWAYRRGTGVQLSPPSHWVAFSASHQNVYPLAPGCHVQKWPVPSSMAHHHTACLVISHYQNGPLHLGYTVAPSTSGHTWLYWAWHAVNKAPVNWATTAQHTTGINHTFTWSWVHHQAGIHNTGSGWSISRLTEHPTIIAEGWFIIHLGESTVHLIGSLTITSQWLSKEPGRWYNFTTPANAK